MDTRVIEKAIERTEDPEALVSGLLQEGGERGLEILRRIGAYLYAQDLLAVVDGMIVKAQRQGDEAEQSLASVLVEVDEAKAAEMTFRESLKDSLGKKPTSAYREAAREYRALHLEPVEAKLERTRGLVKDARSRVNKLARVAAALEDVEMPDGAAFAPILAVLDASREASGEN